MKGVLISIQKPHTDNIRALLKKIEVRKNKPTIPTPFPALIYETKAKGGCGKVIGEFVCDRIDNYECELWNDEAYELIRQFNYDEYGEIEYEHGVENNENCEMLNKACLTWQDIRKYLGQGLNNCYAWHISNLKIYDKPKELSEFKKAGFLTEEEWLFKLYPNTHCHYEAWAKRFNIDRPPQSWCFVEVENA